MSRRRDSAPAMAGAQALAEASAFVPENSSLARAERDAEREAFAADVSVVARALAA